MSSTAWGLAFLSIMVASCSKTASDEASRALSPSAPANVTMSGLTLTSPAFTEGASMPARFTCEGENLSPPLAWSEPPAGTKSFALVVDDPDAPDPNAPKVTFRHWVLYDLPPTTRDLPEGMKSAPAGAREGKNDYGRAGYRGPCPPAGRHRYFFKLYALDTVPPDLHEPSAGELERHIDGHVLARGQLMATYEKGAGPKT